MAYNERLKACKLPTLHYRHTTGDMIMHQILSGKYDAALTPQVNHDYSSITTGNLRLKKNRVKYNLRNN